MPRYVWVDLITPPPSTGAAFNGGKGEANVIVFKRNVFWGEKGKTIKAGCM